MNVGQMLVSLGFEAKPVRSGFPCPAVIGSRERLTTSVGHMLETREEVEATIDAFRSVGERATTKRSPGNWN